jgi:hypothetical protein
MCSCNTVNNDDDELISNDYKREDHQQQQRAKEISMTTISMNINHHQLNNDGQKKLLVGYQY